MPTCIYCRATTTEFEPKEHPLPEAFGSNEILPDGACCKNCNSYLKELDDVLLKHNHLAGFIAYTEILGKKGKKRKVVSEWVKVESDSERLHIETRKGIGTITENGIQVQIPDDPKWDDWKFSRALHKVALGMHTWLTSPAETLHERFDETRTYVRAPHSRKIIRPYLQRIVKKQWKLSELRQEFAQNPQTTFIIGEVSRDHVVLYMHLWVDEFVVALSGELSQADIQVAEYLASKASNQRRIGPPGQWFMK